MLAVFAGTLEGRTICEALSDAGVETLAFTATEYGSTLIDNLPFVNVNAGRLDAEAIANAIRGCEAVIDATHPYAVVVSRNIREAAEAENVRYVRIVRPSTESALREKNLNLVEVGSAQEAVDFLNSQEGNVLLTTGSKDLSIYAGIANLHERVWPRFLPSAEAIEIALSLGYSQAHLICLQGPFSCELNVALLHASNAKWLVTKDTGTVGGFEDKVSAAVEAGVGVVVIRRPLEAEEGITAAEAIQEFAG